MVEANGLDEKKDLKTLVIAFNDKSLTSVGDIKEAFNLINVNNNINPTILTYEELINQRECQDKIFKNAIK